MSFYTPKVHFNPNTQVITVPNKNIQSYFMRNENSYFVKEESRFPLYKKEDDGILTVILLTTDLIFSTSFDECIILTNNSAKYEDSIKPPEVPTENIELAETGERLDEDVKNSETKSSNLIFKTDILVSPTIIEDKAFFETLFYMSNFNTEEFGSIDHAMLFLFKKIQETHPYTYRGSFINLVFQDLFNRTEIMAITDMFLKWFSCKGIMITPYSLACCFGTNISSATVFHIQNVHSQVNFVEDFCYIYGHKISRDLNEVPLFITPDSEDFVEEFNKQRFSIGKRIYTCKFCLADFEQHADIISHLKKDHLDQMFDENDETFDEYFTEKSEDIRFNSTDEEENFNLLLKNLGPEKEKKVTNVRIIVGEKTGTFLFEGDKDITLIRDVSGMCALRGALAFINLDCSKDMWLTDCEWYSAGLRLLKEKLLFYI